MTAFAELRDRAAVDSLRRIIARERILYEVRRYADTIDWRECDPAEPFDWAVQRPLPSAKRFFFPPRETLLRWERDTLAEDPVVATPFALFGLRACDATALAYQDRFFARDPRYQERRRHALIVVVDCLAACDGGFCREMDAGPFATAGFDLALTLLADGRVAAVAATDAGRTVLAAAEVAVAPGPSALAAARDAARRAAEATFPPPIVHRRGDRPHQRARRRPARIGCRVARARPLMPRLHRVHDALSDVLVLRGRR